MRKILVVEDEDAIREVVALNLRLAGYEVTEAASAEQALAVFSPSAGFDVGNDVRVCVSRRDKVSDMLVLQTDEADAM